MPEVNLVPMLDVLMTVLTFFIIVSMTLTLEQGVQLQLPSQPEDSLPPQTDPAPLVVNLTRQGIVLDTQTVPRDQLELQMQHYLDTNPTGVVILNAESEMPYEAVLQLLGEMKEVGGDRVSLAID